MAYTRELYRKCGDGSCQKQATHEVLDHQNTSYGTFCHHHAEVLVRKLKADGK